VALTWTLWLLAKDQATQQRLRDEVVSVAGQRAIGPEDIDKLNFCRQVLQEAMRLFPPAPAISRFAKTAMTLGSRSLPEALSIGAGARVHIPIYALHRNARLWPNPNAFDPDRFAPEFAKTYSRYAFMPFGGGGRICIGAGFAMIEAVAILATLVRTLRFHPLAGHKPTPVARVTLRPKGGMPLLVTSR
jgi:cytochrome P450